MAGLLVLLAGSAVLGLIATGRTWATVSAPSSLTGAATEVSGGDLVPLASPVFLVALAAALVIPVMRVVGRRIVGAVVAVLAVALVVTCVRVALDLGRLARDWVGGDGLAATTAVTWPVGTAVVAALVAVAAVLVVLRAPSWPGLSSRYERRPARRPAAADDGSRGRDTWDALDRGDDPTA